MGSTSKNDNRKFPKTSFAFRLAFLLSAPAIAAPNPFEAFVGKYQVVGGVCYLNNVEYSDGCAPDRVAVLQNKVADEQNTILLTETFPSAPAPTTHRLFQAKVDTAGVFIDASFVSHFPRHAQWIYVYLDSNGKEERRSIKIEQSKDGVELTFTSLLKTPRSVLTQVRSYWMQPF